MGAAFGDDDSDGGGAAWRPNATFTAEQVGHLHTHITSVRYTCKVRMKTPPIAMSAAAFLDDLLSTPMTRSLKCYNLRPHRRLSSGRFTRHPDACAYAEGVHCHGHLAMRSIEPHCVALEQVKHLEELWEEHGAAPDAVQRVRDGLDGGAFSRTSVARQLKAMGLKRGALTTRQVRSFLIKTFGSQRLQNQLLPGIGADTASVPRLSFKPAAEQHIPA